MQLQMSDVLGSGYKSKAQIARRVTEHWAVTHMYCTACIAPRVVPTPCNTQAVDFFCDSCGAEYQLKSSTRWSDDRITDAGYEAMMPAVRSDSVPNLLILQYTAAWTVRNLLLVPSFFFSESAVEKRKPLSATARRAGWIGCNILLSAIAPDGKIRLVHEGVVSEPATVREQYALVKPLARLEPEIRGWTLDVLKVLRALGQTTFRLSDVYGSEAELFNRHPNNRHVRPKIRQQLQVLRDLGLLRFTGRGQYELVKT